MEGDRSVAPPKGIIAKINVLTEDGGGLGLDKGDQQRFKKAVAFAIKHILGGVEPFCDHDEAKLRSAVEFIEKREPRLSVCESGLGACALLSRAVDNRRPRKRRGGSHPRRAPCKRPRQWVPGTAPERGVAAPSPHEGRGRSSSCRCSGTISHGLMGEG